MDSPIYWSLIPTRLPGTPPPVLLTTAGYYGTLAAARCLGRAGVRVTMADASFAGPAHWSKFVTRRVRCPSSSEPDSLIEWLLLFGPRHERHVLAATSDDTAWLFSLHRDELARSFALYQPPLEATWNLLNKRRLHEHCLKLGLDVPNSWFPESPTDLQRAAKEARFPLLIKPVTQVLNPRGVKGERIYSKAELQRRYPRFACAYPEKLLRFDSTIANPMLQEFFPEAAESIYNLSGFIDESGEICSLRAGQKVLQRPRQIGIGICFEDAPIRRELVQSVMRLARHVGYYGVFEVEFIRVDQRFLLIDFNPRFYSQMAFDIERGLPLPLFQYHAALGEPHALRYLQMLHGEPTHDHAVFTLRLSMNLLLFLQRWSGALSAEEVTKWNHWYEVHREHCTDAVFDRSDWIPAVADAACNLARFVRHPSTLLRLAFNR